MRLLLQRIKAANLTLNDEDQWQATDEELAARCRISDESRIFLGEKYVRDQVANSDSAVSSG